MKDHNTPSLQESLLALEEAIETAPLPDLPALLGTLEWVKALGWGRMLGGPHNSHMDNGLLTIKDVAQRLKVSEYRVYELARQGVLKAIRLGKTVRVTPNAVTEYLAQNGG